MTALDDLRELHKAEECRVCVGYNEDGAVWEMRLRCAHCFRGCAEESVSDEWPCPTRVLVDRLADEFEFAWQRRG